MTASHCPNCGAPLPANAPEELCPRCLLQIGLSNPGDSASFNQLTIDSPSPGGKTERIDLPESGSPITPNERVSYFGDYELVEEIAKGGMGVVYRARQVSLNRQVALKMIKSGEFADEREVQRFQEEAEAAANLDHPHIVPIHEVGEHQGRHYFTMKLIEGISLEQNVNGLKENPLSIAELMEKVAQAVHHAHQRGIMHRDLKPGNILIDADGEPHVTDFGLAKKIEGGKDLTQSGAIIGTPEYMSPEQAQGQNNLTTAADIYSLGAILYTLLTGKPPFRGENLLETLRQVGEQEPIHPRSINLKVDRDLETICLKCLEKEPQRRYASAHDLAEDLLSWQSGEPIKARPVGQTERAFKWIMRNKSLTGALVAVVLVLLVGAGISIWQAVRATVAEAKALKKGQIAAKNEKDALEKKKQAEILKGIAENRKEQVENFAKKLGVELERSKRLAQSEADAKNEALKQLDFAHHTLYLSMLDKASFYYQKDPDKALEYLHDYRFCPINRRCAIWRFYERQCNNWLKRTLVADWGVSSLSISPDGKMLATAGGSNTKYIGELKIWDFETGKVIANITGPKRSIRSVCFSPDGKTLAYTDENTIKIWDLKTGKITTDLEGHTYRAYCVRFSPDGKLATGGGHFSGEVVKLWDLQTFKLKRFIGGITKNLAFSPDGSILASAPERKYLYLWDVQKGRKMFRIQTNDDMVYSLSFSPDGKMVASGGGAKAGNIHGKVKLWDVETGKLIGTFEGHTSSIYSVSFSPDGKTIASASRDKTIKLWDVESRQEKTVLKGHPNVRHLTFGPKGKFLVSSGGREIKIWQLPKDKEKSTFYGHSNRINSVRYSPDGKTIVSASGIRDYKKRNQFGVEGAYVEGEIKFRDAETGEEIATVKGHRQDISSMSISPDGKILATAGKDNIIILWDFKTRQKIATLKGHTSSVYSVCFSPDGKTLASGSGGYRGRKRVPGVIKLWNVADRKELATLKGHTDNISVVRFSPDGKVIATASYDKTLKLWDVEAKKIITTLRGHGTSVYSICFHPDGQTLASSSGRFNRVGIIKLWDVETGKEKATLRGHNSTAGSLCYSPDGKTLASTSQGWNQPSVIKLWDAKTGQEKASFEGHTRRSISSMSFSPDGQTLASASYDFTHRGGEIKLWDLSRSRVIAKLRGHNEDVKEVRFSKDGLKLLSSDEKGNHLFWDLKTGQQIQERPAAQFLDPSMKSPKGELEVEFNGPIIHLINLSA